jgi:hypothetical protein
MNNGAFDAFAIAIKILIVDLKIKTCDDCSLCGEREI